MAHADEIGGVVGENLRSALDWLPQARELITIKMRRAAARSTSTNCAAAAGQRELRDLLRALRIQDLAARACAAAAHAASRARPPPACTAHCKRCHRRAATKPSSTEAQLDRWLDQTRARRTGLRWTPKPPGSTRMHGTTGRHLICHRAAPCRLPAAGAPLCRRAGSAESRRSAAKTQAAGWKAPASPKLGQNLKYDRHIFANHGIRLARHRRRHPAAILRAGKPQAARHGQPGIAPPRRQNHQL